MNSGSMDDMFAEPTHKLVRKNDPETSKEAAAAIPSGNMAKFVYEEIVKAGAVGITANQIKDKYPSLRSASVTARPKTLEQRGLIFYRGDKRDGSRIIRDSKFDTGRRECPICQCVLLSAHNMICKSPMH